jgi:biopolymer transport protein ExbB
MPNSSGPLSSFEFLLRGGFMMYPLLLSALVALAVMIERFIMMHKKFSSRPSDARELIQLARKGDLKTALMNAEKMETPVASVLAAGLRDESAPIEEVEIAMQNQAELWVPQMEKRLEVLDTVITAAPLMGLLGTITGMMSSFQVLSEKGVNEPHAITGGVAEALIATATGLVIALICLFAFNYFNNKVKTLIFEMESAAAQLIEARRVLIRTKVKA